MVRVRLRGRLIHHTFAKIEVQIRMCVCVCVFGEQSKDQQQPIVPAADRQLQEVLS